MNEAQRKLHDMFEPYFHTFANKDSKMIAIMQKREEYEKTLDEMWRIYLSGNMKQLFIYKDQVKYIKDAGLEVLRSKSTGKHKITYKK